MSNKAEEPEITELPVTFQPYLYEQRRAWVLEVLRREQVTAVLDVGCGEGQTIACLCNPAPWRSPLSVNSPGVGLSEEIVACLNRDDFLHLSRIFAFDVSLQALKQAVSVTIPQENCARGQWHGYTRWESLEVTLWEGGLESYNAEFVNMDCIICTEVIEHLPEDILPEFAPMLLGMYHPRLLLVTTPSYTFNARFTAPNAPPSARNGYPDPTRRTSRVFRHDDHKFEWTVQEFSDWCRDIADKWGYEVDISGVGKAREKDPWGRDDELGYASQIASFKRKEGGAWESARKATTEGSGIWERTAARQGQNIIATHCHEAHESAGKADTLGGISERVKTKIEAWNTPSATIHELWFEQAISSACGGWLGTLVVAVQACGDLILRNNGKRPLEWVVEWTGFVGKGQEREQNETEAVSTTQSESDRESTGCGNMWSWKGTADVDTIEQPAWDGAWGAAFPQEEATEVTWGTGASWGSAEVGTCGWPMTQGSWGQNVVAVNDL